MIPIRTFAIVLGLCFMLHTETVVAVSVCSAESTDSTGAQVMERQHQGRTLLELLGQLEWSYYASGGSFTSSLINGLNFLPTGEQHYVIGFFQGHPHQKNTKDIYNSMDYPPFYFSSHVHGLLSQNLAAQAVCPETSSCSGDGGMFEANAIGNVDSDSVRDIFKLSSSDDTAIHASNDRNSRSSGEWATEMTADLHALHQAMMSYRSETGVFSNNLSFSGLFPMGEKVHVVGFPDSWNHEYTSTLELREFVNYAMSYDVFGFNARPEIQEMPFDQLARTYCSDCGVTETTFKAIAIGNIDSDSGLHVMTIDQDRRIQVLVNDQPSICRIRSTISE